MRDSGVDDALDEPSECESGGGEREEGDCRGEAAMARGGTGAMAGSGWCFGSRSKGYRWR